MCEGGSVSCRGEVGGLVHAHHTSCLCRLVVPPGEKECMSKLWETNQCLCKGSGWVGTQAWVACMAGWVMGHAWAGGRRSCMGATWAVGAI